MKNSRSICQINLCYCSAYSLYLNETSKELIIQTIILFLEVNRDGNSFLKN